MNPKQTLLLPKIGGRKLTKMTSTAKVYTGSVVWLVSHFTPHYNNYNTGFLVPFTHRWQLQNNLHILHKNKLTMQSKMRETNERERPSREALGIDRAPLLPWPWHDVLLYWSGNRGGLNWGQSMLQQLPMTTLVRSSWSQDTEMREHMLYQISNKKNHVRLI